MSIHFLCNNIDDDKIRVFSMCNVCVRICVYVEDNINDGRMNPQLYHDIPNDTQIKSSIWLSLTSEKFSGKMRHQH